MLGICAYAKDDVPDDLPEGTIKIAEGIYAYTPSEGDVAPANSFDWTTIESIPQYGTIVQPASLSNVIVDNGDKYMCLQATKSIRINLVRNNTSIFGTNMGAWPKIGGSSVTTYYIEAAYYNISTGVAYQMQCTSASSALSNVQIRYFSDVTQSDFID